MDGIAVDSSCRGQGIGSQLLREIVAYAQQQTVLTLFAWM